MNTTEFDAAYHGLLTAAESISGTTSLAPDARSAIDWTLSHIALSDRVLTAAARDVLTGLSPVVDNREAMDSTAITALIARSTHLQRVAMVRRNASDLSAVIRTIPDHAAATPALLRLVSREGQPLPDQRLLWSDLIRLRATEHIPGHTQKLTALASA